MGNQLFKFQTFSPYNIGMKLQGLRLDTIHFEEYLSFLTEVLELEVAALEDESMVLDLQGTWLEIRKATIAPQHKNLFIRFQLAPEEYESLINKISFFSYRKGETLFQFVSVDSSCTRLMDPDGRSWIFSHSLTKLRDDSVAIL